jgi:hypothetical protein
MYTDFEREKQISLKLPDDWFLNSFLFSNLEVKGRLKFCIPTTSQCCMVTMAEILDNGKVPLATIWSLTLG